MLLYLFYVYIYFPESIDKFQEKNYNILNKAAGR